MIRSSWTLSFKPTSHIPYCLPRTLSVCGSPPDAETMLLKPTTLIACQPQHPITLGPPPLGQGLQSHPLQARALRVFLISQRIGRYLTRKCPHRVVSSSERRSHWRRQGSTSSCYRNRTCHAQIANFMTPLRNDIDKLFPSSPPYLSSLHDNVAGNTM